MQVRGAQLGPGSGAHWKAWAQGRQKQLPVRAAHTGPALLAPSLSRKRWDWNLQHWKLTLHLAPGEGWGEQGSESSRTNFLIFVKK